MATCPACAKDYTPPAAFCPHCGAVLDKPNTGTGPAGISPSAAEPAVSAQAAPRAAAEPRFGDAGVYIVRRFLALVIDIVGVGLLIAIGLLVLLERINTNIHPQTPDGFRTFLIIVAAALFLYYWLFEAIIGTTLGKLLFGLEVRHDDGGRVGFLGAFVRNLIRIVDLAVIGFLLAAITPRRKRLGDMIAGTIVPSHRMGAFAPILAIIILGGVGYLAYAYGNAMKHAQDLYNSAQQFGPALLQPSAGASPAATTPVVASPGVTATPGASPVTTGTSGASPAATKSP